MTSPGKAIEDIKKIEDGADGCTGKGTIWHVSRIVKNVGITSGGITLKAMKFI